MNLFAFCVLVTFSIVAKATPNSPPTNRSAACEKAYADFNLKFENLEKTYALYTKEKVIAENKPSWIWGTNNQAVYLLHGFIGTKYDLSMAATEFTKLGYTVVSDIIPGHGLNALVANQFKAEQMRDHVESNLNSLRSCYSKIHVMGFSTGGLLIHDYLRRHNQDFTAASVTLYSPFYKPRHFYSAVLGNIVRLFTDNVSAEAFYKATEFPDVKIALLRPANYLQQIPLDVAGRINDLGSEVYDSKPVSIHSKLLLFVSDSDETIDIDATLKKTAQDFSTLSVQHFTKADAVPHHLMLDEVSPKAKDVLQKTIAFATAL